MQEVAEIWIFSAAVFVCTLAFFGKRSAYRFRRGWLLLSSVSCLVIPLLDIKVESEVLGGLLEYPSTLTLQEPLGKTVLLVYLAGVACSSAVLLAGSLRQYRRLQSQVAGEESYNGLKVKLIFSREAFSLFRTIYIPASISGMAKEAVLRHEYSHISKGHTWERVLMQVLKCLLWFNPFIYLADIMLEEVQEYEADRAVLDSGFDKAAYVSVIVGCVMKAPAEGAFLKGVPAMTRFLTAGRLRRIGSPPGRKRGLPAFVILALLVPLMTLRFERPVKETSAPVVVPGVIREAAERSLHREATEEVLIISDQGNEVMILNE